MLFINKAIFWDLQGTLGGEAVVSIDSFVPFTFAAEALKLSKEHGYLNIIITNQSRIGKGEISLESYKETEQRICDHFNAEQKLIESILCCPHQSKDNCNCKKPKTGLIDFSVDKYDLDITQCYVVGDMGKNEIVLAHNAGCKGVLVLTGGGEASLNEFRNTWSEHDADIIAENAFEAVRTIISEKKAM